MVLTSSWSGTRQVDICISLCLTSLRKKQSQSVNNVYMMKETDYYVMHAWGRNFLHILEHMWPHCCIRGETRTRDQGAYTRRSSIILESTFNNRDMNLHISIYIYIYASVTKALINTKQTRSVYFKKVFILW